MHAERAEDSGNRMIKKTTIEIAREELIKLFQEHFDTEIPDSACISVPHDGGFSLSTVDQHNNLTITWGEET
jgi:hypothetical protein